MPRSANLLARRPDLHTPLVAITASAVALLDCVAYQLLVSSEVQPALAWAWTVSTILPWALVWLIVRRWLEHGMVRMPVEIALIAGCLAASVALDMLLFEGETALPIDALQRLQARLPIALVLPLLARVALRPCPRPDAMPSIELEALRGCTYCSAAGNYVEAHHGERTMLMRATMRQAEAALGDAYLRVHRSIIVARAAIVAVDRDRHGICGVRLTDGRRLPVGRAYRSTLRGH